MSRQVTTSIWLAWRDWKHEIFLSLCAVLALISMLSPILVLIGLKNGVIDGMRKRLLEDPSVLIITPKSDAGEFTKEFVEELAKLPGAGFAIGKPRANVSDFTFTNPAKDLRCVISLEPAAEGEPVLKRAGIAVPANGAEPEIVLSAVVARALDVGVGGTIALRLVRRGPDKSVDSVILTFHVSGILPVETADRRMAFVPLRVLEDIQNFVDFIAVPERGFSGTEGVERKYSSFRLYAKDLYSVESLAAWLAEKKIETITKSRDIAITRNLEKGINDIIMIIASAIGAGFIAFTISSVQGSVLRKKRQLALLRLFGLQRLQLMCFPLAQIFLTLVTGFLLSLAVYWLVSLAIERAFAGQANLVCVLTAANVGWIALVVAALSALACAWGAWKSSSIEPSTVIRGE